MEEIQADLIRHIAEERVRWLEVIGIDKVSTGSVKSTLEISLSSRVVTASALVSVWRRIFRVGVAC